MHNAAFRALEMDWAYLAFPIHPDHVQHAVIPHSPLPTIQCLQRRLAACQPGARLRVVHA